MSKPITRVSIIHEDSDDCQVLINGVVSREMKRLMAKEHEETERRIARMKEDYKFLDGECKAAKAHRDMLLKQRYEDLMEEINGRKPHSKLYEGFAMVMATLMAFAEKCVVRVDEP